MENGILVGLSAQTALRRQLEVVANNLANMNTTGFKREKMLFTPFLPAQTSLAAMKGGRPVFVEDKATVYDVSPGRVETTEAPLDLAIRSDGYFVVETPQGIRYTRDGQFHVNDQGQLVTAAGDAVLGSGDAPITLDPTSTQIAVAADGTISSESGDVGRLHIVRFSDAGSLRGAGSGLWSSEAAPLDAERPDVVQGMLERSNVEPILELEQMIQVQRAYEQAKQLVEREDERIKKMVQAYAA
ncbi:MAG: flagellar basal-body rod protein FlgF [Defluviicoccus sp.]|nr:flagellar basal-body rod protein FlgF [Defluviicoccus sp.]MDG4593246.1 flagellar basal-body rod protein FlgF [Defluviicoccus sp.]